MAVGGLTKGATREEGIAEAYHAAYEFYRAATARRLIRDWLNNNLDPIEVGVTKARAAGGLKLGHTHGPQPPHRELLWRQEAAAAARTGDNPRSIKDWFWTGGFKGRRAGREDFWDWLKLWIGLNGRRRDFERLTIRSIQKGLRDHLRLRQKVERISLFHAHGSPFSA